MYLWPSSHRTDSRDTWSGGRATTAKPSDSDQRDGRTSYYYLAPPLPTCLPETEQVHAAQRHRHAPLDPDRHLACAVAHVHARQPTAYAELDGRGAGVRRAVFGAQLVLRAHVLRALVRLGANDRDGERGERGVAGQDGAVGRAVGGGAEEEGIGRGRGASGAGLLVMHNAAYNIAISLLCRRWLDGR